MTYPVVLARLALAVMAVRNGKAVASNKSAGQPVTSPSYPRDSSRVTMAYRTPAPTTPHVEDPCETSIDALLSPPMAKCLAVAHDASSSLNLDAFHAVQSRIGYPGHIGDFDECAKVVLFDEATPPTMQTHHCLAGSLSLASNEGTVPFGGLCVPDVCTPEALSSPKFRSWLAETAAELEESKTSSATQLHFVRNLLDQSQLAADMNQGFTCGSYKKPRFGWDACSITAFMVLLVVLIGFATWMDLTKRADYPQMGRKMAINLTAPQRIKYAVNSDTEEDVYVLQEDHINEHLAAFSMSRNLAWLFDVGEASELGVFDGLRVLSVLWVMLEHTLAVQISMGYVNPQTVYPPDGLLASILGQLFFSARFALDTLLFVSGFLVVHAMLRRFRDGADGTQVKMSSWLPFFYLHRFLRITPPYVFSLLIWWKLAVFMGGGPFWYRWENFVGLCDRYWWSNLLYVNNLVPWHAGETEECFFHTWYLANDMQFYLVSPVFIALYMRKPLWGTVATLCALLASASAMAIGTLSRGWSALALDGSLFVRYSEEAYTMPYFRIVSYLGGVLFAMLWNEKQVRWPHHQLTDGQRYLMLSSAILMFSAVAFSGYSGYQQCPCSTSETSEDKVCGSGWGMGELAVYNALSRPAWCLALVLLCFVCFNGQGGLIQQALAHRAWAPLARLTFGAYLLHPLIINLWFLNATAKFRFSRLNLLMDFVSVAAVTVGSSLVMALLIEGPLTRLGRHLERILKPRPRVHKANIEYFSAEQFPGSIERQISGEDPRDEFMSQEEQDDVLLVGEAPAAVSDGGVYAGRSNGGACIVGTGTQTSRDEFAALLAHTNPGYRDYMTRGLRKGSEAFG